ncbi:hypothetical protein D3C73_1394530 [compost metagenome]
MGKPVVPEVKISSVAACASMCARISRGNGVRGAFSRRAAKCPSMPLGSGPLQGFSASRISQHGRSGKPSVACTLARHSSPITNALASVVCNACSSGRPVTWVLMKATTTPSLTRPNQVQKNAGRFSMARAQTSPARRPLA